MDKLIKEVAEILKLDEELVKFIIESYIRHMKRVITKVKYKELKKFTEKIKTNIMIPGFGKMVVTSRSKYNYNQRHENDL